MTSVRRGFSHVDADPEISGHLVSYLLGVERRPDIGALHALGRSLATAPAGGHVLDAGSGAGGAALALAEDVGPAGTVVGVDLSETMVAVASARVAGSVRFEVGDLSALHYPDGEFDLVRCERVLQHLADPDAAVRELVRVCRPGGQVLLIDTDWSTLAMDAEDPVVERVLGGVVDHVVQPRSGVQLRRRLVRAGCRDVRAVATVFTFTSQADAAGLLPFFDPELPSGTPLLLDEHRAAWFAAVERVAVAGEFLVTFTAWAAAGRR